MIRQAAIWVMWRARNDCISNMVVKRWDEVVDEIKVLSWRWLLGRFKVPACLFYEWEWSPRDCLMRWLLCSCCQQVFSCGLRVAWDVFLLQLSLLLAKILVCWKGFEQPVACCFVAAVWFWRLLVCCAAMLVGVREYRFWGRGILVLWDLGCGSCFPMLYMSASLFFLAFGFSVVVSLSFSANVGVSFTISSMNKICRLKKKTHHHRPRLVKDVHKGINLRHFVELMVDWSAHILNWEHAIWLPTLR